MDEALKEKVLQLYVKEGKPLAFVAKEVSHPLKNIRNYLAELGVLRGRGRFSSLTEEQYAQIAKMREEGLSYATIGKEIGMEQSSIWRAHERVKERGKSDGG